MSSSPSAERSAPERIGLIRILIIAPSATRAKDVAELFAEDERFEIVGLRSQSQIDRPVSSFFNVIIAVEIPVEQLPTDNPVVLLGRDRDTDIQDERVRALLPVDAAANELIAAAVAAAS